MHSPTFVPCHVFFSFLFFLCTILSWPSLLNSLVRLLIKKMPANFHYLGRLKPRGKVFLFNQFKLKKRGFPWERDNSIFKYFNSNIFQIFLTRNLCSYIDTVISKSSHGWSYNYILSLSVNRPWRNDYSLAWHKRDFTFTGGVHPRTPVSQTDKAFIVRQRYSQHEAARLFLHVCEDLND